MSSIRHDRPLPHGNYRVRDHHDMNCHGTYCMGHHRNDYDIDAHGTHCVGGPDMNDFDHHDNYFMEITLTTTCH